MEEHLGKQWQFLVREECEDELPQLGAEKNWYEVEVPHKSFFFLD